MVWFFFFFLFFELNGLYRSCKWPESCSVPMQQKVIGSRSLVLTGSFDCLVKNWWKLFAGSRGVGPDVLQWSLPAWVVICFYGTHKGPKIGHWGDEPAIRLSKGLNSAKGAAESSLEKQVVSFFQGEPAPTCVDRTGVSTACAENVGARPEHAWQEPLGLAHCCQNPELLLSSANLS